MARPLEQSEYTQIISLLQTGFTTHTGNKFRPNEQIALAFQLQASLGLRIGDTLKLKVSNFRNGKLEQKEEKTDKLQYRDINPAISERVKDYALSKGLKPTDKLFDISTRGIQKQLGIITNYLALENIGTHSFRKMYATWQYETSGNDIHAVKELLNHTSVSTTQKYIRVSQQRINELSAKACFL